MFVAFGSSTTTVTLGWTPVPNAVGYTLERKAAGGAYAPLAMLAPDETEFLDRDLGATTYTYRLRTVDAHGANAGLEREARPDDGEAVITHDDAPIGAPVEQVVGAAGGSVSTLDGTVLVTLPPGAVPDNTQVTLQSFVNPLPDDPRPGLAISTSAPLTGSIRVTFTDDIVATADPRDLAIARQQDDGMWVTQAFTIDVARSQATVAIDPIAPAAARQRASRPSGLSPEQVKLLPPLRGIAVLASTNRIPTGKTVTLRAFGRFSTQSCDVFGSGSSLCVAWEEFRTGRPLPTPIRIAYELLNVADGRMRSWTVHEIVGGNPTWGTVVALGERGARYTAPAKTPSSCFKPCPVSVEFVDKVGDRVISGGTVIQVVDVPSVWQGDSTSGATILEAHADIKWTVVPASFETAVIDYKAAGDVRISWNRTPGCDYAVASPITFASDSFLTIDFTVDPPVYEMWALAEFDVDFNCEGFTGTFHMRFPLAGNLAGGGETVTQNGAITSIHGMAAGNDYSATWRFDAGD